MQNYFTRKQVPSEFTRLAYNKTISIHPNELAYYALKHYDDADYDPDTDDAVPYSEDNYAEIDMQPHLVDELLFLEHMGLLVRDQGKLYVSPLSAFLYTPVTGGTSFFTLDLNSTLSGMLPPARTAFVKPFLELVARYTLPGRISWLRKVRGQLPDTIHLTNRYDHETREMQELINKIRTNY